MNNQDGILRQLRRMYIAPRMLVRALAWGMPKCSLIFGPLSLGDDLLCTAVLHEARERGQPFAMFTQRPELFLNNPDPFSIHPIDDHYLKLLRKLGHQVCSPYYVTADPSDQNRDVLPDRHVIAEMCRIAGLKGEISIRPYLHLTPTELNTAPRLPRQIAIQTSGLSAALPYQTKEWGPKRFETLAKLLSSGFSLVQLGSPNDPALPSVALDLRGQTTLREAAAIQASSLVFVGLEGFLTHLARAVDCPSVVIHGGRAAPHIFGYSANINLHSQPSCSPCGLRNSCPHDMSCMSAISPEEVAKAVTKLADRPPGPLPVETAHL